MRGSEIANGAAVGTFGIFLAYIYTAFPEEKHQRIVCTREERGEGREGREEREGRGEREEKEEKEERAERERGKRDDEDLNIYTDEFLQSHHSDRHHSLCKLRYERE